MATGPDGLAILAGFTEGSWVKANAGVGVDFFPARVLQEDTNGAEISSALPTFDNTTSSSGLSSDGYGSLNVTEPIDDDTISTTPPSDDSGSSSVVIGVVLAVVAVVAVTVAGVCLRKRRKVAKQKNNKTGDATARESHPRDDVPWGVPPPPPPPPRAVELPRFVSMNRPIPSLGDLPTPDTVPRDIERPRVVQAVTINNRSVPSVSDLTAPTNDDRVKTETPRVRVTATNKRSIPPPVGDLPPPSGGSSAPSRRPGEPSRGPSVTSGGYDVARAVLDMAHKLARQSQFPGVSEAATLVSTLVNLISDGRGSSAEVDARLKKCRLLITMLDRAVTVLGKIDNIEDNDTSSEMKGMLVENVQDAIGDLVDLIQTFRSKNKITQVVVSTLFKRRMDETQAVINHAFSELMVWVNIDTALSQGEDRRTPGGNGNNLNATEEGRAEGLNRQRHAAEAESIASARRQRRRRNLDQIEIPEDQVTISEEILGKGGFGAVYIADYNGRNAAAKVIQVNHEHLQLADRGGDDFHRKSWHGRNNAETDAKHQRTSLLLELQTMIRLRSPYTVNVYGAITSLKDRLVLVMELLTGGDLRSFLRNSEKRLPELQARKIIADVCAGMAFLHSKNAVHGDIKSANVLLDGDGRAKIADFGTSKWAQHSDSTGLATYKTTAGNTAHIMSFAWASPEVLDVKGSSYASDVYSFGIVAWEVLSMQVPWEDEAIPLNIYKRVVFKGERPTIPADAPADIATIVRDCWAGAPEDRPTSSEVMRRLKSGTTAA